ncbi:CD99 molecule isoform X2 [Myripristis murdjan]|uniref:CD99 molecule isoform X2 n=1 Tax=Myripristis murdjan TaxID=586833 RepID=UPI00117616FC|nr:CD99 antigen-like isoform X2 [Myripristis murdjan]
MKLWLGFACLLFLVSGVVTQGFDLGDAVDETPAPKAPVDKPKANDDGFDLSDAFGQDPTQKPKSKPSGGNSGVDDILDTLDFGPPKATKAPRKPADNDPDPKPNKPAVNPSGGRTGSFGDFDLSDAAGDGYKPDQTGGGGRAQDPGYDPHGGSDGAGDQAQAGSGQIAGIASAIGVALLGAASSYFAYQKKKLCFKLQGGVDPESGKGQHGTHSDPQVLSNLLRTS